MSPEIDSHTCSSAARVESTPCSSAPAQSSGESSIRHQGRGSDFVTLVEGQSNLLAFTCGTAYCLSKSTGNIMWQSEIKDLKNHIASLAVDADLVVARRSGNADGAWVAASASGDAGDGDGDGGSDGGGD